MGWAVYDGAARRWYLQRSAMVSPPVRRPHQRQRWSNMAPSLQPCCRQILESALLLAVSWTSCEWFFERSLVNFDLRRVCRYPLFFLKKFGFVSALNSKCVKAQDPLQILAGYLTVPAKLLAKFCSRNWPLAKEMQCTIDGLQCNANAMQFPHWSGPGNA